jgi:hypothetical protein
MGNQDYDRDKNEPELLFDEQSWDALLEPTIGKDPNSAESLAHLLFYLKKSISQGPEGCLQAIATLECGLSSTYLYTESHKLAFALYILYLTGELKPCHEPEHLIKGVLDQRKKL